MNTLAVRRAEPADAAGLARVAAVTFPLACPSHTSEEAKASFVAEHLTEANFAQYLTDPTRDLQIAESDGLPVGYTMLVTGEPTDPDVAEVVSLRPTVELSKCYVMPSHHGAGIASGLMTATLDAARARGAVAVWLGVNEENERAQAFYRKNGFVVVGRKRFLVGGAYEDDFVMERVF